MNAQEKREMAGDARSAAGGWRPPSARWAWTAFLLCTGIMAAAMIYAARVQEDFGRVAVSNVVYPNVNGIPVRAKLLRPSDATAETPVPGVVYVHGYQNNRETSDPFAIELARRGIAVLEIDAIGRGNSGNPGDPRAPDFDPTYGAKTSLAYLRERPFVRREAVGLMGHSLGAEMVYAVALADPEVRALAFSGFAWDARATETNPKNMLMIFGKWDEYRKRMTGTRDVEREWMQTPQVRQAIPGDNLRFAETYGDFRNGTARRVVLLPAIHVQESHSREAVAEAVAWMKAALAPRPSAWRDPRDQIWPGKEWATLAAMLAGVFSLLPLGLGLLRTRWFFRLLAGPAGMWACPARSFWISAGINGLIMWLYLPLVLVLFAIHVYVVRIDGVFPMMMVNGTVWWFVWINIIGFILFRSWRRRGEGASGTTLAELGLSDKTDGFGLDPGILARSSLLAALLFLFLYAAEHYLERLLIVDFRFVFPFASDLTPYRAKMFLRYFPFLLLGFLLMNVYVHGRIRRPRRETWWGTWVDWTLSGIFVFVTPLALFLLVQYVPLLLTGFIPFVGPGGVLATFAMGLFHIVGVLLMAIPLSVWFYLLTGKIWTGSILNAALVTWMFVSSQVIAPIPV